MLVAKISFAVGCGAATASTLYTPLSKYQEIIDQSTNNAEIVEKLIETPLYKYFSNFLGNFQKTSGSEISVLFTCALMRSFLDTSNPLISFILGGYTGLVVTGLRYPASLAKIYEERLRNIKELKEQYEASKHLDLKDPRVAIRFLMLNEGFLAIYKGAFLTFSRRFLVFGLQSAAFTIISKHFPSTSVLGVLIKLGILIISKFGINFLVGPLAKAA